MSLVCHREPMSFYVGKIERGEPFTSLLYGDGEMLVALDRRTGRTMAYGEVVTEQMVREMGDSLHDTSPDVIHGTDLWLINWREYPGGDVANIQEVGLAWERYTSPFSIEWYDGVVWEDAVRAGQFGPFLKALQQREVVLVGNHHLSKLAFLQPKARIGIPPQDAYSSIERIEMETARLLRPGDVCIVCTGLGAIPLIMRLRKQVSGVTYLDLGSTFDVFVRMGGDRGWRNELYYDYGRWQALIAKNLEGVPQC